METFQTKKWSLTWKIDTHVKDVENSYSLNISEQQHSVKEYIQWL